MMEIMEIIFYLLIFVVISLRLSMFSTRWMVVVALIWGGIMWATSLWLSEQANILHVIDSTRSISMITVFADSLIFMAYCVYRCVSGRRANLIGRFLDCYPGVMLWCVLVAMSIWLMVRLNALSFGMIGCMSGAISALIVFMCAKIMCKSFRYVDSRKRVLYVMDVILLFASIIISGI